MASLHHVELCTAQAGRLLRLFTCGLQFRPLAVRSTPSCTQWVLNSGRATFVITQKRPRQVDSRHFDRAFTHGEPWTQLCCGCGPHVRDSVFNVALHVRDVAHVTERAARAGATVLQPTVEVRDSHGTVSYSVVGSLFGNVVHTLLNKDGYRGRFLPNFLSGSSEVDWNLSDKSNTDAQRTLSECQVDARSGDFSEHDSDIAGSQESDFLDHVTLTCRRGESGALIDWYESVFGMQRFILNRQDSPENGVQFGGEIGLALKAMEYWRCAETGLTAPPTCAHKPSLKVVVAESLHDTSQVETFNRAHGGPGVQHIGLHVRDIVSRVSAMQSRGVRFRKPPSTYYTTVGKGAEILSAGMSDSQRRQFERLGLLIDSEADTETENRYLMQIFSEPLFAEDTFFLEVLERRGARGFGQGNITALARSIMEDARQRGTAAAVAEATGGDRKRGTG